MKRKPTISDAERLWRLAERAFARTGAWPSVGVAAMSLRWPIARVEQAITDGAEYGLTLAPHGNLRARQDNLVESTRRAKSFLDEMTAEAARLALPHQAFVRAMLAAWPTAPEGKRSAAVKEARATSTPGYWAPFRGPQARVLETFASTHDLEAHHVIGALWEVWRTLPQSERKQHAKAARLTIMPTSKSTQILIRLAEGPATLAQLVELLPGTGYGAISVMLDRLKRRGQAIGGSGDGTWGATEAGRVLAGTLRKKSFREK